MRRHLASREPDRPLGPTEPESSSGESVNGDSPLGSMFLQTLASFHNDQHPTEVGILCVRLCRTSRLPAFFGSQSYSSKTNVSKDLLILIRRSWYSMKPSFLNLFMKKFTRERVVPIISDKVSCETVGS